MPKGDASMGTETHVSAQIDLNVEQLDKLVLALGVIDGPEYTDDPMVNYAADAVVQHRLGLPMWPYNDQMYTAEALKKSKRATCSDECKSFTDKPQTADNKWHALACPNHTSECCSAKLDD